MYVHVHVNWRAVTQLLPWNDTCISTVALERHGDSIAQPERPAHAGSGEGYPGTVAPETPNNLQSGAPPISNRDPPTTSVGAHSPVPIAEGPTGTLPRPGDHLLNGRPFERPFPGGFLSRDPFSRGPFPDRLFPAGPPPGGLRRGPYQAEPYPERLLLERPHPGEPPTGGLAPGGPLSEEPFPGGDFPEGQHPEGPFPGELSPQGPHPAEPLVGEPFSRGPLPGGPFPGGPFLGGPLPGGPFPMGPFPMRIRTFPRRLFPGGPSHAGLPHEGSFPDGPFPGLPSQDDAARPHIARSQGEPTQEKTPVPPSRPRGEPLFPAQGYLVLYVLTHTFVHEHICYLNVHVHTNINSSQRNTT